MRKRKELKTTTNSTLYRRALSQSWGCDRCPPNRGCNRDYNDNKCWKTYRKTQYYEK